MPLDETYTSHASRYRLTVVASSIVDVVGSAGGWLCDRARAGWDVNVVVADAHDARPLKILGATAHGVDGELVDEVRSVWRGGTIAISAHVLAVDEQLRRHVLALVKRGLADVTVWGRDWPAEFGREGDRIEHKLSSAARAFKALALGAADSTEPTVGPTETLFSVGIESLRPLFAV